MTWLARNINRAERTKYFPAARSFETSLVLLLVTALLARLCEGLKAKELQGDATTMTEMLDYMEKFGYMPESSGQIGHLITAQEIKKSVKMVQRIAGLQETGRLDDATARFIKMPRCGVTDHNLINGEMDGQKRRRRKRYTHYSIGSRYAKWNKEELTWRLDRRGSMKVERRWVIADLERSFRLWSDASSLRFRRVEEGQVDIEISFERGSHNDGYAFDGQGRALAHAFPPQGGQYDGDMHMDDDEFWMSHEKAKKSTDPSASIFVVAAHELGHSLGLDHSKDTEALMYAAYTGPRDYLALPDDDRMGIQILYGANGQSASHPVDHPRTPLTPSTPSTPARTRPPPVVRRPPPPKATPPSPPARRPPPPRPPPPPRRKQPAAVSTVAPPSYDFCNTAFDVVTTIRGELFLFKNELMWRVKGLKQEVQGPSRSADFWIGLPKDLKGVDTVYERQTDPFDIVFFIGANYYSFVDTRLRGGYPRPLSMLGLPPDVRRVEAALGWGHRGRSYLFSGGRYWRLDEGTHRVEPPEDVRDNWRGVPHPLNSAFRWTDGKTYFFQEQLFWEFNERNKSVSHPTGRLLSSFWLDCPWPAEGAGHDGDNSVHRQRQRQSDGGIGSRPEAAVSSASTFSSLSGVISLPLLLFLLIVTPSFCSR